MMLGGTTTGVVLLLALLGGSTTGPAQFRWGLAGAEATAFLESSLPLKPLVSTPVELLKGNASAAVTICGRQAITVVFSRPVIALGSDFGKADNFGGKVPFTLTCAKGPVPAGKFRWVTTTIARFDPDVDWPTDLDCEFAFNAQLTAYDGAVVKLSGSTSRRLRTQPLAMSFSGVTSKTAERLTGGDWSGTIGMPDDALPEVPPDGVVTLSFSYPVNLALIRAALQLQPNPNGIKLNITRCVTPTNWWPRGGNTPATPQEGDDGCVAVTFSGPLKDETKYQLVLPAGSKYSNLTGPTTRAQTVGIAGLRAFRVPIRQDFQKLAQPSDGLWDGVSYRRLKMWLPHGLKQASDVTALVGQVSLCKVERPFAASSDCTPVPINSGKLVSPAFVQLQVNGLMPRTRYRVSVQASSSILDGYNKPLKASQGEFWTMDVSPYFSGPDVPVAVFDQDTLPSSWPYMAYGTDPLLNTAQVWSLDVSGEPDIRKLVQVLNGASILVKDILGTPTDQVGRGSPTTATRLNVPLDPTKPVHVLAQCCSQIDWPAKQLVSANVQLVLRSRLTSSWVVAPGQQVVVWATSTEGSQPGPVAGATAYLYATSWQGNTTLIGSCVTGGDGSCAVAMPAPSPDMGQTLVGMVQGPNKDLSFTPNAGFWSQPTSTQYVGSLVLDRALVRPGDSLHITGYVAQKNPSKDANALSVKAADVKQALLVVSPGWTGSTGYSTVRADVDPTYGSLHATIPVPSGASMGAFQVTLYIPDANHQSGSIMADAPPVPPAPPVDTAPGPIMVGTPAALPAGPGRRSRALLQAVMPINGKRPGTGSSDGFDASGYSGLSTQSITVSDPRPPTADLTLKAPAWVAPTGKASLSLQAVSYLGSSVAGAAIDITWRTSLAQGLLTVTTDAAGAATATIDLSSLPLVNRSSDGDSLNVNAAWVGPTRERIVRSATVRLQATARRVEFDVTLDTALPGVPFGVNAHVFSNEDNQEIKGVALEVTLKPNSSASGACNTTSTCSFKTGDSAGQQACQLSLPCIGHYVLRVFTNDASPRACANVSLGMNATEWAAQPLSAHMSPKLTLSASQYKLGDTAGLQFQNPWAKATALVLWGNTEQALSRKLFLGLKQGPVTLDIKLGQECRGGCAVMLIVSVPRLPASTIPPGVVVSKLFDPAGAHTFLTTASIEVVEPRKLDVSVSVTSPETTPVDGKAVPVVAPGGSAAVSVSVAKAGQPVGNAEVTLLAVDKAVLDLLPYPLRDLSPELTLSLAASLTGVANDGARLAPGVVDLVFSTLARRLGLDPWLPVDTTVFPNTPYSWSSYLPGYGQYAVDQNDTAYLDLFTSLITYAPNTGGGWRYPYSFEEGALDVGGSRGPGNGLAPSLAAPMPSPVMLNAKRDKANDGSSSSSSSSSVRLASKFVATPLFTVIKTKADGAGQATFKAPANLGTFLVRAYAAQPQLAGLGSAEAPVVVRRKLSLTASIPRITRVGDTFSAGVLVTSPGLPADAPEFLVIIKLKLGGSGKPLKLTSRSPTATAKLSGAKNQVEVRFSFSATRIGSASLTFSANDGRGAVDALGATLPVLAPQSPVFLATSFALKPPSSKTTQWQEGLELPSAVPGTGSLDLLAGVGNLPTILAALNAVTTQRALTRADEPLDAVTSLALAAQAPLLAAYSQQLSSTQQANASDAIAALVSLTDASYGLLPYKPGTWGFYPNRADIVLNAQAVWLLSHLPKYTKGPLASQWQSLLAKQLPTWKSAAVKQLIADATANRNPPFNTQPMPYSDYYTLAWVRLALGGDWEVPQCSSFDYAGLCTSDVQVRSDLSLAALLAAAPEAGLAVQVLLASALQDSSSRATYSTFITTTVNTLVSNFRVQGRTAYIAAYPGARAAASLDLQTFALRLLRAAGGSSVAPLVQKLDAYVAASGAPSNGGHLSFASILPPVTPSPWVVALVCSSLAAYDQAQGSTQPDLSLQARVGTNTVLKATFSKATVGKPPVSSSTPWSKLGPNPGALDFNVQGTGEVSVSAGLTFVPAQPLQFPTYRGVWVSAVIQATDPLSGQPTGPPLAQAPLGSLLTITIQVVTPDDLGAVTLEALVAGGLEPLDPALTSSSDLPATPVCPLIQWLGSGWANVFWGWWWPICPAQEIRPEVVTWKWQRLPAGTSSVVYRAVAATRGTFQLPPIKAYVDDQPEVMGQTASSLFKVCSGAACSAQPAPQAGALPKDCPNDCSGQGACNTSAGTCVCKPGFAGPDCSVQQA